MRPARVYLPLAAFVLLCCAGGALLAPERGQRFVVPGAYDVQVSYARAGERTVSFRVAPSTPDWAYALDRSLRAQGWLPPDFSGAAAQFTIYTHVMSFGAVSVWEEAQIDGTAQQAHIRLRRWLRLSWPQQLLFNLW